MGRVRIRVVPNARADACAGLLEDGETFKVKLHAPAVDGKANRALAALLSATLGVGKSAIRLTRGEKARSKTIEVEGLEDTEIRRRLIDAGKSG